MKAFALGLGLLAVSCSAWVEGSQKQYAATVTAANRLVAYWPMEGNLKDIKGALKGRVFGDVAFCDGVAGGQALSLAKGGFLYYDFASQLDLERTTIEFFFKIDEEITAAYDPCLIAKRNSSVETRFSVHIMKDLSNLAVWNGQGVKLIQPADGPFEFGRWYHVAIANAPSRFVVYIDGFERLRLSTSIFNLKEKDLPLEIGASSPKGDEAFHGAIDEIAIYGRGLLPEEIVGQLDAAGWAKHRKHIQTEYEEQKMEKLRIETFRRNENMKKIEQRIAEVAKGAPWQSVYEGNHLDAISLPVGGIGAGQIQFNGKAEPCAWQIFNNYDMAKVPHSFFAVYAKVEGEKPIVRVLQTTPAGPFQAMESVTFEGEYPYGQYAFHDPEFPAKIWLAVWNPLIPMNARDSAMPCVVINLIAAISPDVKKPVEIRFLAAQQNAVGFTGQGEIDERAFTGYGKNVNHVLHEKNLTILHMTSKGDPAASAYGDMALAAFGDAMAGTASWESLDKLATSFASARGIHGSRSAGPSADGETLDGALSVQFPLKPAKEDCAKGATFVLAWHFPNAAHGATGSGWLHTGNMYSTWWENALAVAREVHSRYDDLRNATMEFRSFFSKRSNLPPWLLQRIISQVAILRSPTVFWAKDGYVGGWEGCNAHGGCCDGNCAHVWHYAQAHARLFPDIARRMREEVFDALRPDGSVPFRQPTEGVACDAQTGEVLECYREYLTSPDAKWLKAHWPAIKSMMDYAIKQWDDDEDGVLAGSQHNTLDCFLGGSTSWLGSMYLAALKAASKMAALNEDTEAVTRYRRIFDAGAQKQNETLFNGEYYIQIPDPEPLMDYDNGCHIDQVLGQWWAHQLDLGWIYPKDRVQSALRALLKYNFHDSFQGVVQAPRKFVDDNDAGMQMIQWPNLDRPAQHTLYADEVMSGFEYSAAATMIQSGMPLEGLMVIKAAADRYDGRLRTGLTPKDSTSWGYSGNPFGDDECGKFYARAMSVWSALLACQGFIYDGPAGRIGFKPVFPGAFRSFFSAAEGWGCFEQSRSKEEQHDSIDVSYGTVKLSSIVLEIPAGAKPGDISVSIGSDAHPKPKQIAATLNGKAELPEIVIDVAPFTLKKSEKLDVRIPLIAE